MPIVVFKSQEAKCESKKYFLINIVVLQRYPGLHTILYGLQRTSVFGTDPRVNHTTTTSMCSFPENENYDVNIHNYYPKCDGTKKLCAKLSHANLLLVLYLLFLNRLKPIFYTHCTIIYMY